MGPNVVPFKDDLTVNGNGVELARRGLDENGRPTNRVTFRPNFEPRGASPEGWGIDKLACFFPIDDFDDEHQVWGRKHHQAPRSTYEHRLRYGVLTLPGKVSLHLKVQRVPAYGKYGAGIEFTRLGWSILMEWACAPSATSRTH